MEFKKEITIGTKTISETSPVFIIAEAGVNHNGDVKLALKLVEEAKKAGADCVKFQTWNTDYLESKYSIKPNYFDGRDDGMSKIEFVKSLEFGKQEFDEIKKYCDEVGIIFLSTPTDIPSLELLLDIGCPAIKISSSDTFNYPLFKALGETGLPVLYSTGMSGLHELEHSMDYLCKSGVKEIGIMQCTSQYPAPYNSINLKVINTFKDVFNVPVGLSDHSEGLHIPVAAVAMGAKIVEKHFTLSRNLPGVDHVASIEPDELQQLVLHIKEVEDALGDGEKVILDIEAENVDSMRKSLFTLQPIKKGEVFTLNNVGAKRPGGGINPIEIDKVLGFKAAEDISNDEYVTWQMIEK